MAKFPPGPVIASLTVHTSLAVLFVRSVCLLFALPVMFGWRPSDHTVDVLSRVAGSLVRVTVDDFTDDPGKA